MQEAPFPQARLQLIFVADAFSARVIPTGVSRFPLQSTGTAHWQQSLLLVW